jgi:hypothetical protein
METIARVADGHLLETSEPDWEVVILVPAWAASTRSSGS